MKLTINVIEILINFKIKGLTKPNLSLKKPSERRKNLKRKSTEINRITISGIGVKKTEEIKADETNGIKLFSKTQLKRLITNDNCQRNDSRKGSLQMKFDDMSSISMNRKD